MHANSSTIPEPSDLAFALLRASRLIRDARPDRGRTSMRCHSLGSGPTRGPCLQLASRRSAESGWYSRCSRLLDNFGGQLQRDGCASRHEFPGIDEAQTGSTACRACQTAAGREAGHPGRLYGRACGIIDTYMPRRYARNKGEHERVQPFRHIDTDGHHDALQDRFGDPVCCCGMRFCHPGSASKREQSATRSGPLQSPLQVSSASPAFLSWPAPNTRSTHTHLDSLSLFERTR